MDKMKIGLAGSGLICRHHFAPGVRRSNSAELVGIAASTADKAREFAEELNIPRWYTDFDSMLADPDIDAVIIGTPNFLHCPQSVAAARAGKHVLCEKPMALDMKESSRMVEACDQAGVTLMIAHHLRYKNCNRKAKEIVESVQLGKISSSRIQWSFNSKGEVYTDWHIHKEKAGGGQLMNLNSHCVDLLAYLFGPAKKVSSFMRYDVYTEIEDISVVMIEFENGVLGVAEGGYNEETVNNNLEIFGSKASLIVEKACSTDNRGVLRRIPGGEATEIDSEVTPYTEEVDHFAKAIREGFAPDSSGANVLETMRIITAAYESVQTGKHVRIIHNEKR